MIIVKNRELIIPREEFNIGTTYDSNTETRVFKIDRVTAGGVDISNLTFKLDLKYANNGTDISDLVKEVHDDYILLTMRVLSSMVQVPGTVLVQIRALDSDGGVKWTSYYGALFVETSINTPGSYTGSLTELEQLESRVEGVLSSEASRVSAENARASAETARASAETARASAERARVTAENARASAEASRVSTFNTNEAQRTSTASASEASRASTFSTNESQRTSTFNADIQGWEARVTSLETGYDAASLLAQSYARGGTGTRAGEDTDNAMYYKEQAQAIAIGSLVYDSERIHFGDTDSSVSGGETSSIVAEDENGVAKKYTFKDTTARSSASSAQSTANTAVSNAATAQSAAEAAQSTANSAVSNAATAQTSADNAMARASIQSNDNLLDNPWFTVNQRGNTSYQSNTTYCADRWYCYNTTTTSQQQITSSGIILTSETIMKQKFESLGNGKYTLSAKINGTIYSTTVNYQGAATSIAVLGNLIQLSISFEPSGNPAFRLRNISSSSITIRSCKLELGSVSTLANDSAPNYAAELVKCMRYLQKTQQRIVLYNSYTADGYLIVGMPIPIQMRTTPSATFNMYNGSGVDVGGTVTSSAINQTSVSWIKYNTALSAGVYRLMATFYADL